MSAKRVRSVEELTANLPKRPTRLHRGPRPLKAIDPDALLFSRKQVCRMLGGVHPATVVRLEKAGKLRPKKLTADPSSVVYYPRADVMALIEG